MKQTTWTNEQKLAALMALTWSVSVETDPADGSFIARVAEVPDAIATGATERELARDLFESLECSLDARLQFNDDIPLPTGQALPWMVASTADAPEDFAPPTPNRERTLLFSLASSSYSIA